jgi:hypothetical protein
MADAPSADAQGYVALVAELKQRIADARRRLGRQGRRPACLRPRASLRANDRPVSPKPQIHVGLRRGLARPRIYATGRLLHYCPTAIVSVSLTPSSRRPSGRGARARLSKMVGAATSSSTRSKAGCSRAKAALRRTLRGHYPSSSLNSLRKSSRNPFIASTSRRSVPKRWSGN